MQDYIERYLTPQLVRRLKEVPAVAILGPRQVGKSTLARHVVSSYKNAIYLDLEKPSDLNKLQDPEAFFDLNRKRLICLDEIQRAPELFAVLRGIIDENRRNGQFLILGSASRQLIQQSSESLAGRISYFELPPFQAYEIDPKASNLRRLWLRGGFPRSYLARSLKQSFQWRIDFIRTYLERDIPLLGFNISPKVLERFWRMCAHSHGQVLNLSKLGGSLGVSHHTIRSYVDLLEQTFLLRVLPPFEGNLKKRLIKSPKIYIRDSGLLHALLDIEEQNDLLGHPGYGSSWEGFVIENILACSPQWRASYYRTSSGAEIDLILEKGNKKIAVEIKASSSPKISKALVNSLTDLKIKQAWVVAPVKESYPLAGGITAITLQEALQKFSKG